MAIRYDVSIDWVSSPRLLTVAAPSVEISIQQLVDTCRYFEDSDIGVNYEYLIDAAGKEPLGGTTYVGITATLNNCQIAFEARLGPDWILCTIDGGNVVAEDENGDELDPRKPTAFISVDRTASSSATLQEQDAIQYSSYQNAVWVDIASTTTGIEYPAGTREDPVNNVPDAVLIGNAKGLSTISFLSDYTLIAGDNIDGFHLIGESHVTTVLIVSAGANCSNVGFSELDVTGILDGGNELNDCIVRNISNFSGHIHNSGLIGDIILNGNALSVMTNCSNIDLDDPPVIDMGGSGQSLSMSDWSGLLTIKNLSSASEEAGIAMLGGIVTLDPTVSAGFIGLGGVGVLIDNSTGTAFVEKTGLMSKETVSEAVWDEPIGDHLIDGTTGHEMYHASFDNMVHINTVTGAAGTTYPTGTHEDPVNNLPDAILIAKEHNFEKFHCNDDLTINGENITGYTFMADRSLGNSVTVTSMTNSGACYFTDLTVSGTLTGPTRFTTCVLGALTGFDGGAKNCLLTDNIDIVGSGANYFTDCDTYVVSDTYKEISVNGNFLNIIRGRGSFGITNFTGSAVLALDLVAGQIKIFNSCVSGTIVVSGLAQLTDESAVGCTVIDAALTTPGIADGVWDESTSTHQVSGSFGELVTDIKTDTSLIPGIV